MRSLSNFWPINQCMMMMMIIIVVMMNLINQQRTIQSRRKMTVSGRREWSWLATRVDLRRGVLKEEKERKLWENEPQVVGGSKSKSKSKRSRFVPSSSPTVCWFEWPNLHENANLKFIDATRRSLVNELGELSCLEGATIFISALPSWLSWVSAATFYCTSK